MLYKIEEFKEKEGSDIAYIDAERLQRATTPSPALVTSLEAVVKDKLNVIESTKVLITNTEKKLKKLFNSVSKERNILEDVPNANIALQTNQEYLSANKKIEKANEYLKPLIEEFKSIQEQLKLADPEGDGDGDKLKKPNKY